MFRLFAFFVSSLILFSASGCSENKETPSEKQKDLQNILPFNRSTPCSVAFIHARPIETIEDIKNIPLPPPPQQKGEYETTVDFEKRVAIEKKEREQRFENEKIASGYNGFVKVVKASYTRGTYDADKGVLVITQSFPSNSVEVTLKGDDTHKFDFMYKFDGTLKKFLILFYTKLKDTALHYNSDIKSSVNIKMSISEAKELERNLSAAMVGRLVPPYRHLSSDASPAAVMETTCAVLFNEKTGAIVYEYQ